MTYRVRWLTHHFRHRQLREVVYRNSFECKAGGRLTEPSEYLLRIKFIEYPFAPASLSAVIVRASPGRSLAHLHRPPSHRLYDLSFCIRRIRVS
jgi:hypothetical protein